MSFHSARRAVTAIAILAALVTPIVARAQNNAPTASAIIPVANSPAIIQTCKINKNVGLMRQWDATLTLGNRTKHSLIAADAQFVAYDTEGTKISQVSLHFSGFDVIDTRDTGVIPANLYFDLTAVAGNPLLIAKISCKILGAQFTADKKWQLGQTWPEPLLSIETETMVPSSDEQGAGPIAAPAAATPRYTLAVVNSWNDTVNGALIVHDTIVITGGNTDVQLRATDLSLSMTLAGGAKKSYLGLGQPAPQYAKISPLNSQPTAAYEVAPGSDLGALGVITVPAHGSATTTVSFFVNDPVARATDNRGVTAR